jgi:hypothetical protein
MIISKLTNNGISKKFIFKIRLIHSYGIIMVKVFYNIYTSTWAFKLVHGLLTNVAISSDYVV